MPHPQVYLYDFVEAVGRWKHDLTLPPYRGDALNGYERLILSWAIEHLGQITAEHPLEEQRAELLRFYGEMTIMLENIAEEKQRIVAALVDGDYFEDLSRAIRAAKNHQALEGLAIALNFVRERLSVLLRRTTWNADTLLAFLAPAAVAEQD